MSKPITNATLPSISGFVEVETNGQRRYQEINNKEKETMGQLLSTITLLKIQNQVLSDRGDFVKIVWPLACMLL
jgi:hypothetical protein